MLEQNVLERAIGRIKRGIIIAVGRTDKLGKDEKAAEAFEELQCTFNALEKKSPKKIDRVGNKCPVCKCYLASEPIPDNYCFSCGQAIDWSVDE